MKVTCYTDHQLFDRFHRYRTKDRSSKSKALTLKELKTLQPGEQWDEVLLVRYPNIAAFFGMVMAPDYQAESIHRTAALRDARLICTVESSVSKVFPT